MQALTRETCPRGRIPLTTIDWWLYRMLANEQTSRDPPLARWSGWEFIGDKRYDANHNQASATNSHVERPGLHNFSLGLPRGSNPIHSVGRGRKYHKPPQVPLWTDSKPPLQLVARTLCTKSHSNWGLNDAMLLSIYINCSNINKAMIISDTFWWMCRWSPLTRIC